MEDLRMLRAKYRYVLKIKFNMTTTNKLSFKLLEQLIISNFKYQQSIIKIQKFYKKYIIHKKTKINQEIINLKTEIFKLQEENNTLKYKLSVKPTIIYKNKYQISKTKPKIKNMYKYNEIKSLSNKKLIDSLIDLNYKYEEIKNLSKHQLKTLINKSNNDKYNRQNNLNDII